MQRSVVGSTRIVLQQNHEYIDITVHNYTYIVNFYPTSALSTAVLTSNTDVAILSVRLSVAFWFCIETAQHVIGTSQPNLSSSPAIKHPFEIPTG